MLFSTSVDPHWFKAGNCFWYEYKTGNGNVWYVVDPSAKTKRPLFDQDKLAAELTEIVKDPYTAQQLPIQKLETGEDGRTFTFQITIFTRRQKRTSTDKDKKTKKGGILISPMIIPTREIDLSGRQKEGYGIYQTGPLSHRTVKPLSMPKT